MKPTRLFGLAAIALCCAFGLALAPGTVRAATVRRPAVAEAPAPPDTPVSEPIHEVKVAVAFWKLLYAQSIAIPGMLGLNYVLSEVRSWLPVDDVAP